MSKGKRNHQQMEEAEEEARQPIGRGEPVESEVVAMFRVMMEEQRKEIERREERREEARAQRELELAEKQAEIQRQSEKRQYEQQVELFKLQEKMGEAATRAHREGQQLDRKRDRALYSIPVLKVGEDI